MGIRRDSLTVQIFLKILWSFNFKFQMMQCLTVRHNHRLKSGCRLVLWLTDDFCICLWRSASTISASLFLRYVVQRGVTLPSQLTQRRLLSLSYLHLQAFYVCIQKRGGNNQKKRQTLRKKQFHFINSIMKNWGFFSAKVTRVLRSQHSRQKLNSFPLHLSFFDFIFRLFDFFYIYRNRFNRIFWTM